MNEIFCKNLIEEMTNHGWKLETNNDENISFSFFDDEDYLFFRNYNKKDGNWLQFNGRQTSCCIEHGQVDHQ